MNANAWKETETAYAPSATGSPPDDRATPTVESPSQSRGTAIHSGVYAVTFTGWALLVAAYWTVFAGNPEAIFVVAVSTIFFGIYFGLAALMMSLNRNRGDVDDERFSEFMARGIETNTGHMTGASALVQVALVPVALGFGTIAMAVIIALSR